MEGYTFMGWYTEPASGSEVTKSTKVTIDNNHTLYGRWRANNYKVTLNNNGTGKDQIITVTYGSTYNNLPTPTKKGYKFMGWYPQPASGYEVTKLTSVTTAKDHTLYGRWSTNSYEVTLHNNVTGKEEKITVFYDSTYSDLPTLTMEGYTFMGWYTEPASGSEVTKSTKVTIDNNHTLYGRWRAN
jgi:uncharacterized repeat protein (TIGR02543 family)